MWLQHLGLAGQGLWPSVKQNVLFTAAGALVISAVGMAAGFSPASRPLWWFAFYILLSVPVQEVVFRSLLAGRLERFGKAGAILCSAALYAAIHVRNPVLTILTFAAGIAWGWSFLRTHNVAGPILSHIVLGSLLFLFVL